MTQFALKSLEFRREREAAWQALDELVGRVEQRGLASLSAEELHRLPTLYRGVVSSLSVARAISLDKNLLAYLEGLAGRAYLVVYTRRRRVAGAVAEFFAWRFPALVRSMRWALLLSAGLLLLGTLTGYALVLDDPERFYSFVDAELAGDRGPTASKAALEQVLYDGGHGGASLLAFAAFLFANNAKIGLTCFALGFAAGVPVMLVLLINGLMLGAMWAIYVRVDLGFEFVAWVLPHGVTEILAIAVCGAAGLAVGYAVVFPGRHGRLQNVARRGREAALVVVGAVLMFLLAALLEGFFRQLVHDSNIRVALILLTAIGWLFYFTKAGRRQEQAARAARQHQAQTTWTPSPPAVDSGSP